MSLRTWILAALSVSACVRAWSWVGSDPGADVSALTPRDAAAAEVRAGRDLTLGVEPGAEQELANSTLVDARGRAHLRGLAKGRWAVTVATDGRAAKTHSCARGLNREAVHITSLPVKFHAERISWRAIDPSPDVSATVRYRPVDSASEQPR